MHPCSAVQRGVLLTLLTACSLGAAPTGELLVSAVLCCHRLSSASLSFLSHSWSQLPPTVLYTTSTLLDAHSAGDLCPCLRATAMLVLFEHLHSS